MAEASIKERIGGWVGYEGGWADQEQHHEGPRGPGCPETGPADGEADARHSEGHPHEVREPPPRDQGQAGRREDREGPGDRGPKDRLGRDGYDKKISNFAYNAFSCLIGFRARATYPT